MKRNRGTARYSVEMPRDLGDLSPLALAARRLNVATRQATRLAAWHLARRLYPESALPAVGERFPHLLYARTAAVARAGADPDLERGKLRNLALAAPHLDGLVVAPGAGFSFWRALPRPTAARGYQHGMELRGGCIVPSLGGGLCLLSNALFAAAGQLGWRILERHAHTMAVAGGNPLDATVLWPHVNLRFAPRAGRARLQIRVKGGALSVAVWSDRPAALRVDIAADQSTSSGDDTFTSAVRRVVRDERGALLEDTFLALDRKRLLDPDRGAAELPHLRSPVSRAAHGGCRDRRRGAGAGDLAVARRRAGRRDQSRRARLRSLGDPRPGTAARARRAGSPSCAAASPATAATPSPAGRSPSSRCPPGSASAPTAGCAPSSSAAPRSIAWPPPASPASPAPAPASSAPSSPRLAPPSAPSPPPPAPAPAPSCSTTSRRCASCRTTSTRPPAITRTAASCAVSAPARRSSPARRWNGRWPTHILVRGAFARAVRAAAGVSRPATDRLARPAAGGDAPLRQTRRAPPRPTRALLAGLAAARHGTCEALALLETRPDLELVVRAGEGLEPAGLLAHPRVSRASTAELSRLDGIGLLVAPSWCESYPEELARAVSHGVPVAGTVRAAGFVDLGGAALEPGDLPGLSAALEMALAFPVHQDQAARWRSRLVLADMQLKIALSSSSGPALAYPRASAP